MLKADAIGKIQHRENVRGTHYGRMLCKDEGKEKRKYIGRIVCIWDWDVCVY